MIAVTNTTPLRYLIAIGREHLLERLFAQVLVPRAVIKELTAGRTPAAVRRWAQKPPDWANVCSVPDEPQQFPARLHSGEREAILLAEEKHADVLLIDEHAGRKEALRRGLPAVGTLGLLEQADVQGALPDFAETLKDLKQAGFFLGASLEGLLIQRHTIRTRSRQE